MPGSVAADVGCVHAFGDDPVLVDQDTTDGGFIGSQSKSGLQMELVSVLRGAVSMEVAEGGR